MKFSKKLASLTLVSTIALSSGAILANGLSFTDTIESTLATMTQIEEGTRFTVGAMNPWAEEGRMRGFMRYYKGGLGLEEFDFSDDALEANQVVIDLFFEDDMLVDVAILRHMEGTDEYPTEEDEAELISRILEAQGHEFEPLAHLPLTSHNIAYAVEWTIRIAETSTTAVTSTVEANAEPTLGDANGVFVSVVPGRNDYLGVVLEVVDGVILNSAILHRDTPYVIDEAVQTWANQIVAAQAIQGVDAITGATNTFVAVNQALASLASDLGVVAEVPVEMPEIEEEVIAVHPIITIGAALIEDIASIERRFNMPRRSPAIIFLERFIIG